MLLKKNLFRLTEVGLSIGREKFLPLSEKKGWFLPFLPGRERLTPRKGEKRGSPIARPLPSSEIKDSQVG